MEKKKKFGGVLLSSYGTSVKILSSAAPLYEKYCVEHAAHTVCNENYGLRGRARTKTCPGERGRGKRVSQMHTVFTLYILTRKRREFFAAGGTGRRASCANGGGVVVNGKTFPIQERERVREGPPAGGARARLCVTGTRGVRRFHRRSGVSTMCTGLRADTDDNRRLRWWRRRRRRRRWCRGHTSRARTHTHTHWGLGVFSAVFRFYGGCTARAFVCARVLSRGCSTPASQRQQQQQPVVARSRTRKQRTSCRSVGVVPPVLANVFVCVCAFPRIGRISPLPPRVTAHGSVAVERDDVSEKYGKITVTATVVYARTRRSSIGGRGHRVKTARQTSYRRASVGTEEGRSPRPISSPTDIDLGTAVVTITTRIGFARAVYYYNDNARTTS